MSESRRHLPGDDKEGLDRRGPDLQDPDAHVSRIGSADLTWPQPGEDAADLAILNSRACELNPEAEDALAYQVPFGRRQSRFPSAKD